MKTYALESTLPEISALVAEVTRGEEIVLTDHQQPVARIVRISPAGNGGRAKAGLWKDLPGKFWMAADFDAPLEDFKDYME